MISIVIPTYKRADLLSVCLLSLFKFVKDQFELTVVVDGGDAAILSVLGPYTKKKQVRIIVNDEAVGYTKAINIGCRYISPEAEYVMLVNDDVVFTPGFMGAMKASFADNENVGIVGPTFTGSAGKASIDHNPREGDYSETDLLEGVCLMMPYQIYSQLLQKNGEWGQVGTGLLDERFELGGGEDSDLCYRVSKLGLKVMIARKAYLYHYGSASFRIRFNNDNDYSKKYSSGVFHKFLNRWREERKEKPRVYVAVMSIDGRISGTLAMRLAEWSHVPDIQVTLKIYSNLKPLDNARNIATKEFLEGYWGYILFVDEKVTPPFGALHKLVGEDKDVIAPLVMTFKIDDKGLPFPMPVAMRKDDKKKGYVPYYGQGVEEVDIVTGGCFLVRREILEQIERPFYFTYTKNGILEYTEDFVFSRQVQGLGKKLYTDFGVVCDRTGFVSVKGINDLLVEVTKQR